MGRRELSDWYVHLGLLTAKSKDSFDGVTFEGGGGVAHQGCLPCGVRLNNCSLRNLLGKSMHFYAVLWKHSGMIKVG